MTTNERADNAVHVIHFLSFGALQAGHFLHSETAGWCATECNS